MNEHIIKRMLCLLLCAVLLTGLCACAGHGGKEGPEETPPPTDQPVTDVPAPTGTPEPEPVFTFNNDLGSVIAGLYVNECWEDWTAAEPKAQGIATGSSQSFARSEIFGTDYSDGRYNIGIKDAVGTSYYLYDIALEADDIVTVTARDDGADFTITRGGESETYPAVVFTNSIPNGRTAGMISVDRIHHYGVVLEESAYEGGSDLCALDYELIELNDADVMNYAPLAAALMRECDTRAQQISEEYAAICAELKESGSGRAHYSTEAVVRRADSGLLSILYISRYTHGGVTDIAFDSVNLDPETGGRLTLADITDCTGLTALINSALAEQGSDIFLPMPTEANENEHFGYPGSACWTYDHDGVTLYFTLNGEPVTVLLPTEELPGADPARRPDTENYTVGLSLGMPSTLMINGALAELTVNDYSSPSMGRMAEIVLDGEAHKFDDVHITELGAEAMYLFAHVNGRDFVYVLGSDYASGSELYVLELSGSRVYVLGSMMCEPHTVLPSSSAAVGSTGYGIELITDPALFELDFESNILSTCKGSTSVGFGGNCMPRRYNDLCMLREPCLEFTMLCDLEADMVSEVGGSKAGSITLREGDKVRYICVAAGRYAYLINEDDEIARVEVETGDVWPHTIGGVPIDEIFQGLVWAG